MNNKKSRKTQITDSLFQDLFKKAHKLVLLNAVEKPETAQGARQKEEQRQKDIQQFFHKHISVKYIAKKQSKTLNFNQGMSIAEGSRYEIDIIPGRGYCREPRQDYLIIAKSKIGTNKTGFNFPNDDVEEEITDRSLFNSSGYGLFANRNFKAKECIGVYLGKVSETQSNSGYCFDWAYNGDDYFVDAVGGIGHPVYFGMHLINHSRLHVNVTLTEDLYFSASRDICKGEELYMSYGSDFWTSVETHAQQKKKKRN